jgi:transposase
MDVNTLLADPAATRIEKFISLDDSILIIVKTIQPTAACPQCHAPSCSLKGRYCRLLADLPWHNVPVRIELLTRKFRCRNERCSRKVFCERLPKVAVPFARRTARLNDVIELLAFSLGARPGARAATRLFSPIGKDILLRAARRVKDNVEAVKVRVLGVDDFAFRRGINYGTILIDLEQRKPIDLLPARTAETLMKWLKAHPEIEIVSRDRAAVYAEAANQGAPHAVQVADRWHLLKNLGDLVERFFFQNHCLLTKAAADVHVAQRVKESDIDLPISEKVNSVSTGEKPIPARRQKLFDSIRKLRSEGKTLRGIARELKASRNTVRKYVLCETAPQQNGKPGKPSAVLPFAAYLEKRWREGEHRAVRLWQEIKAQGFKGEVDSVQRFVCSWRKIQIGKISCSVPSRGMSPRQVAKLLLYPDRAKTEAEREYIEKLCEISSKAKRLQSLGIEFQEMVNDRRGDLFDLWLEQVESSGITQLKNWASGLLTDEKAVRNALLLEWSNGQTEGQVNRLKTIKRQMYGRAKFDLLRARVLHRV